MEIVLRAESGRPLSEAQKHNINKFAGSDPNRKLTPLMWASSADSEKAVKVLLKDGADVNIRHETTGVTACSIALEKGHARCAEILVAHHAAIPSDALISAAQYGRLNCLKVLVTHNPKELNVIKDKLSPLLAAIHPLSDRKERTVAVEKGRLACVQYLLENKADVNLSSKGMTAVFVSALSNNEKVLSLLLEAKANTGVKYKGQTPIWIVARFGYSACLEQLLKANADAEAEDPSLQTPLLASIMHGHAACVSMLLDHSVDVNKADKSGRTPAAMATMGGRDDWLQLLLDRGAKPNLPDQKGFTPIFYSLLVSKGSKMEGGFRCFELLLPKVVDINSSFKDGSTLAHVATKSENGKALASLIKAGINLEATNLKGETALVEARKAENRSNPCLALLEAAHTKKLQQNETRSREKKAEDQARASAELLKEAKLKAAQEEERRAVETARLAKENEEKDARKAKEKAEQEALKAKKRSEQESQKMKEKREKEAKEVREKAEKEAVARRKADQARAEAEAAQAELARLAREEEKKLMDEATARQAAAAELEKGLIREKEEKAIREQKESEEERTKKEKAREDAWVKELTRLKETHATMEASWPADLPKEVKDAKLKAFSYFLDRGVVELLQRIKEGKECKEMKTFSFLSHVQKEGAIFCGRLWENLKDSDMQVWYDKAPDTERLDLQGMLRGVAETGCICIYATKSYFTRPWCQFELMVAYELKVSVVVVREVAGVSALEWEDLQNQEPILSKHEIIDTLTNNHFNLYGSWIQCDVLKRFVSEMKAAHKKGRVGLERELALLLQKSPSSRSGSGGALKSMQSDSISIFVNGRKVKLASEDSFTKMLKAKQVDSLYDMDAESEIFDFSSLEPNGRYETTA
eukprot:gb/GEZN01001899.1/.p1 GENE.gb/GEZN01001899.1/~~gb/GEZN01001899.1/.p1  ORF type:complete len:876 (-),score=205.55 gb/GEZN01001899.1/:87-2714(-)